MKVLFQKTNIMNKILYYKIIRYIYIDLINIKNYNSKCISLSIFYCFADSEQSFVINQAIKFR